MKITGDATPARTRRARSGTRCSTRRCWSRTIPGCERLEATGEQRLRDDGHRRRRRDQGHVRRHVRALRPRSSPAR